MDRTKVVGGRGLVTLVTHVTLWPYSLSFYKHIYSIFPFYRNIYSEEGKGEGWKRHKRHTRHRCPEKSLFGTMKAP